MIFKPKALSMATVAICSAGSVVAGGSDIILMPSEVLFEKGNYAEVSVVNVSPNVTGTTLRRQDQCTKTILRKHLLSKYRRHQKCLLALPIICQLVSI